MNRWIEPDWPVPKGVRAISTLRPGGVSNGPYASLNLGQHVGDDPARVSENRRRLRSELSLPDEPLWLRQVHGTRIIDAGTPDDPTADGSTACRPGLVCAVMTADCLPVLLCSHDGQRIGAVHGGWRGLAAGIIEAAVGVLGAGGLTAWLGPAIGPHAFDVGDEVHRAFLVRGPEFGEAFRPAGRGAWKADLHAIARLQLAAAGVTDVHGGEHCTYSDSQRFFSYRRDGTTGRMATLIWRE